MSEGEIAQVMVGLTSLVAAIFAGFLSLRQVPKGHAKTLNSIEEVHVIVNAQRAEMVETIHNLQTEIRQLKTVAAERDAETPPAGVN